VLTLGLAKDVAGENVRVNAVRPGIIYTDIMQVVAIQTGPIG
jgi:NAD(P)-dependent dehydrogenase (short-subunit alcohol dehydrogenase family)